MRQAKHILVVDDDPYICELAELYLRQEMYTISTCQDGADALESFRQIPPDLVILDIMLPNYDGFQICREIRKISDIPVIMLTAKGDSFDKVLGLELGADDYIVKPFDPKELVARVKAVLRRAQPSGTEPQKVVAHPDLVVDLAEYKVKVRGRALDLTPKEIELLYFLATHTGRVFTREQLLGQIWGYEYTGDSRTVDVHINRLRQKLTSEKQHWDIKTVWGVGYKFEVTSGHEKH
ncbi:transcriptional regulatory protein YycF [Peptococcaceae bacterium CEB3]|nr:transcriptional regulatory protein YycF [Peptococcaceae bacterium CEB3]